MNTQILKDEAKKFNLYQLQDIPDIYKTDSHYEHRIQCNKKEIPSELTYMECISVGLFYECKQDTNYKNETNYYIEHSYILCIGENTPLLMLQGNDYRNKGKYYFNPYYGIMHKYQNINYEIRNESIKELKEPNRIGVFTDKKVIEWLKYSIQYISTLEKVYENVNNENKRIEDEIKNTIESLKGCNVSTYQNITDIDTPLFRIRFKHFKDQKYLNTTIEYKGNLQDVIKLNNQL